MYKTRPHKATQAEQDWRHHAGKGKNCGGRLRVFFCAIAATAQQKGQFLPGQQGLNAGVLPEAGFTYANMTINYFADTLTNASRSSVRLSTDYNIWAVENIFFYVPKRKNQ